MWGPIAATRSPAPAISSRRPEIPAANHVLLGPLPPAVDRQSGAALAIAYQDRDAIGDFDGDAGPLLPGGNGVPFGAQEAHAIA